MSKKGGRGKRGQAISLTEFVGECPPDADDNRWAEDEFNPEDGDQQQQEQNQHNKKMRKDYGFVCGTMEGNFREEAPVQLTTVVDPNMKPPFVAYVGNLPHKITDEQVAAEWGLVVEARVVSRGNSTFAYVEFETRDALQGAILSTGKNVGGRKIKVDVASEQQRARLEAERNGTVGQGGGGFANLNRDEMGSAQSPTSPNGMGMRGGGGGGMSGGGGFGAMMSRDDMGSDQQPTHAFGGRGAMGNTVGSSMDLLSRDDMGSSQQKQQQIGGANGATPVTEFTRESFGQTTSPKPEGSPAFGNFRNQNNNNSNSSSNGTGKTPVSPTGRGAFGSAQAQKDNSNGKSEGKENRKFGSRGSFGDLARRGEVTKGGGGFGSGGGSWRDGGASEQVKPSPKDGDGNSSSSGPGVGSRAIFGGANKGGGGGKKHDSNGTSPARDDAPPLPKGPQVVTKSTNLSSAASNTNCWRSGATLSVLAAKN